MYKFMEIILGFVYVITYSIFIIGLSMKLLKPVDNINDTQGTTIFLGGSIDMGSAENWQDIFIDKLKYRDCTIYNPRRDDWDSSWEQKPIPGTPFYEQVTWELNAQSNSNILVYYFADGSQSPITLLELGTFGFEPFSWGQAPAEKRIFVYCTEKFYRYGNVKITCDYHNVPVYNGRDQMIEDIRRAI